MFSPTSQSKMSSFFNTKGPIKPASMLPTQAMVNGPIIPVGPAGRGFALHERPGQQQEAEYYDDEEDYGDEMDYGAEEGQGP